MLLVVKNMKSLALILLVTFTSLSLRIDLWAEEIQDSGQQLTSSSETQSSTQQDTVSHAKSFQEKLISIQKLLEEIENDLNDNKDATVKLNQLKKDKSELQNLANQVRAELNKTRADLLFKGVSNEVIQRHDEFVQKFEEKLAALLTNLEATEKSEGVEVKDKVKSAKDYLSDNLPTESKRIPTPTPTHRIKGLKQAPRQDARKFSQEFFVKMSDFFCSEVQAAEDYLGETIEVQLTQEIKDLAASLDNQPLKIYEYVRNNFEYEPYYGSLKGAVGCLHDKAGNDYDQASLLIALLRAANIQSRYVVGQVEVPIDRAKSWIGVDDPWRVADVLVTYGNQASVIVKGGQPSAIRIEHCWVEAYVDYIPSRGAVYKQPDTWISLDPSFKEGVIYEPEDISTAVSFDANGYLNHQQTGDALDFYMGQLETYLSQAMPDKILSQMGRIGVIKTREMPYLQSVLPNKLASVSGRYAEIQDSVRYKVVVTLRGDGVLTEDMVYQANLPAIGGKRLTLSYRGDQSPYNNPAYTVVLQPEIKLDGVTQVIGSSIGAGQDQQVVIDLIMPNQEIERIENTVTVGGFYTFVCTWPSSNGEDMMSMSQRLNTNITNLGDAFLDTNGFLKEDLTGDFLYLRGKSWFTQVGLAKELASSYFHLPVFNDLGYATTSVEVDVDYVFGMPYKISLSGLMIDADRNISTVIPNTGEEWKTKEYMTLTGYTSSALEHLIWEQKYGVGGISAVKAIQIANENNIPVYDIDSTNVSLIDTLDISEDVKTDMRDAINAGYVVKTPSSNITIAGWTGVGYIIQDTITGEGRYEIAGASGGFQWIGRDTKFVHERFALVIVENTDQYMTPLTFLTDISLRFHAGNVARSISRMGYLTLYGRPIDIRWAQYYLENWPLYTWSILYMLGHGSDVNYLQDEDLIGRGIELFARRPRGITTETFVADRHQWLVTDKKYVELYPNFAFLIPENVVYGPWKIVFINGCKSAGRKDWAEAFGIDYKTDTGLHNEAFVGADRGRLQLPINSAMEIAERFWEYLADNPNATVFDAINAANPGGPYIPPYEWESGGTIGETWFLPTEPYWDFSP